MTPSRGPHKLWGFLLVLNAVFVVVFGGAVAAKVYQYWSSQTPAAPPAVTRPPRPVKPQAESPKPLPPPAAAQAPETARTILPESAPPPKPSLLNDAAAKTSAPAAGGKALPVSFKLRSPNARSVQLVGAFIVHGGRRDMVKHKDGTWTTKLYLNPGQYRYLFVVNGKKTLDPENPASERGVSLMTVP